MYLCTRFQKQTNQRWRQHHKNGNKNMKTNKILANAKNLSNLSNLTDLALNSGNIDAEQHQELKGKIREAQLDNIFAAMAAYCRK